MQTNTEVKEHTFFIAVLRIDFAFFYDFSIEF